MRIMFKRHAQFTLDDGKVLYYEPDQECDVPDELEKNFLFEHLSRSGGLVRIKDTAPAKKPTGDKQPANESEPDKQDETPKDARPEQSADDGETEAPPAAPAKKPTKGKR